MARAALLAVASLLGLAGCGIPPQGVSVEQMGFYDDAVASVGCVLISERQYLPVELQAGLSREQTLAITNQKLALGQAERLEGGGVRLVSGPCAPA
jgi:hypothetical protein